MTSGGTILALAGGVGGAKLANGLAAVLAPERLTIVVNTGDDFDHLGFRICPDLDSVMYRLADLNNVALGWGLEGESWGFMTALERLGGDSWFRLGDGDLATHVIRTQALRADTLSTVTARLCASLGIRHRIVPMSDDRVASIVETPGGPLALQDYFVRQRCAPRFLDIRFDGIETAQPSPGFIAALDDPALKAIVLCPSNPLLSIKPILSLSGIADRLARRRVPVIAVSPFIGGDAVKGPAAKIMGELGLPASVDGMVAIYGDILDAVLVDSGDQARPAGITIVATDTLMRDAADEVRLASEVLACIAPLAR